MCLKTILKKQSFRLLFLSLSRQFFLDISFCHFRHFVLSIINGKDEDNSEYVDYIRNALAEIHKDPLRSRKEEKQSLTNLKAGQLEKIIELAKKITELGKVGQ